MDYLSSPVRNFSFNSVIASALSVALQWIPEVRELRRKIKVKTKEHQEEKQKLMDAKEQEEKDLNTTMVDSTSNELNDSESKMNVVPAPPESTNPNDLTSESLSQQPNTQEQTTMATDQPSNSAPVELATSDVLMSPKPETPEILEIDLEATQPLSQPESQETIFLSNQAKEQKAAEAKLQHTTSLREALLAKYEALVQALNQKYFNQSSQELQMIEIYQKLKTESNLV